MQSMTGYGSCLLRKEERELHMELKTVNHRFLDMTFRLPRALLYVEDMLRSRIAQSDVRRGHIDVLVTYQNRRADARTLQLDLPLLTACGEALHQARQSLPTARLSSLAEMITLCGALSVQEGQEDVQKVAVLTEEAFDAALLQLLAMRQKEGEALAADLGANLARLRIITEHITALAPAVPQRYKQRLEARLAEWRAAPVDPQRMAQEVATMADRCAIDEELSRLGSHIAQFEAGLASGGEIGRKLDFLLQEMNREVNTIGSKASDADIAQQVVQAKCIIEKLREQVQNVV